MSALVALTTLVVWVVAAITGFALLGLLAGILLAGGLAWFAYRRSTPTALRLSGAVPADETTHARLHNLVEGLCVAAGLPKLELYVTENKVASAMAVGRDPRHAAIVVTTGLLENLTRIELEGVLAHELSHIKNYDIRVATLAVTILGLPLQFSAPLLSRGMDLVVGTRREIDADVTGVALTRYPPGLLAALEKLRERPAAQAASPAMAHLWCTTDPPLDERIQALREL